MPNDMGGPSPSVHLLRSVAQNFEALSEIIGRTIAAMDGETCDDIDRLHRAKRAADKGTALAKKLPNFS